MLILIYGDFDSPQNFDFFITRLNKSQNSLPDVRVEHKHNDYLTKDLDKISCRLCTARLFEIRPSNEVRIKLKENSELDKNGYRYVLANNAIKSSSPHKRVKPALGFLLLFCNFFLTKRKKFIK